MSRASTAGSPPRPAIALALASLPAAAAPSRPAITMDGPAAVTAGQVTLSWRNAPQPVT